MIEKLLIKLRRYDTVSEKEEQALRSAMSEVVTFDRGRAIIKAKTEVNASSLLLEGFVHRYKDLKSGARQTLQLALPGDFVDLHSCCWIPHSKPLAETLLPADSAPATRRNLTISIPG